MRLGAVYQAKRGAWEALNAPNADSGHLAAFLSWGHAGHADTNLQVKAKRAALLGQFSEAVKARPVSRSLVSQTQG